MGPADLPAITSAEEAAEHLELAALVALTRLGEAAALAKRRGRRREDEVLNAVVEEEARQARRAEPIRRLACARAVDALGGDPLHGPISAGAWPVTESDILVARVTGEGRERGSVLWAGFVQAGDPY
ncbi:MAG: hypothetical protein JNL21_19455 [Myxococcales bacterium]|nr:hypothetical protein [Myxococcales bacterium]